MLFQQSENHAIRGGERVGRGKALGHSASLVFRPSMKIRIMMTLPRFYDLATVSSSSFSALLDRLTENENRP